MKIKKYRFTCNSSAAPVLSRRRSFIDEENLRGNKSN